jgi:hypothetical protein
MSKADEFQQYAEEAIRWVRGSKTNAKRKSFLDMARAWTQAADRSDGPEIVKELPPEPRAELASCGSAPQEKDHDDNY